MHELVLRIKKPELCYVFAKNATDRGHPELALEAYRRAVELRAEDHKPQSEAERDALRAFYAYEEALSALKGKRTRATGTWQMVNRHGLFETLIKRMQARTKDEASPKLAELGMEDLSFKAVYERHPDAFAVAAA